MNQNLIANVSLVMPLAVATGLFVSTCVIQQPSGALGASGAPDGNYTTVTGLGSIPCMDAPISDVRILADEIRNVQEIVTQEFRHVLLDNYYASIMAGWQQGWRAIVDSLTYDIEAVESDSQRTQTRLKLRQVTV